MKNWIKRFALLAIVSTILSGAVLVGCGGGGGDDDEAGAGARGGDDDD